MPEGGGTDGEHPADALADAPEASGPAAIVFVQAAAMHQSSQSTVTVTLNAPTTAGDFIAVLVSDYPGSPVTSITDDATGRTNVYSSANQRSTDSCEVPQASEIWYARNSNPGARAVTFAVGGQATIEAWVVEFSGLSATGGPDTGAIASSQPVTVIDGPAVTPSGTPALVVSVVATCGTIQGIHGGNPFTDLPIEIGNTAAYDIAIAAGSVQPVWDSDNATSGASTAAFR
jgi:hypothetical protein